MNFAVGESSVYLHKLTERIRASRDLEVVVAPSTIALQPLSLQLDRKKSASPHRLPIHMILAPILVKFPSPSFAGWLIIVSLAIPNVVNFFTRAISKSASLSPPLCAIISPRFSALVRLAPSAPSAKLPMLSATNYSADSPKSQPKTSRKSSSPTSQFGPSAPPPKLISPPLMKSQKSSNSSAAP